MRALAGNQTGTGDDVLRGIIDKGSDQSDRRGRTLIH